MSDIIIPYDRIVWDGPPDPHCEEDYVDYSGLIDRMLAWVNYARRGKVPPGDPSVIHFWGGYIDTWRALEGAAPPDPMPPQRAWYEGGLI